MNSINKTARGAGILYLMMSPFAIFSLYVRNNLFVSDDAAMTAQNIMASEELFLSGIVSWLVCQTIFIVLVLNLFKLLKSVNRNHAALMVVLALVAVPIAFINELNQISAFLLLSGADYLAVFETEQLQAQVMFFFDLHSHGTNVAQMFWGLWLFPFGYLVFKSGFLPRILGVLLMIGCFGYLIDFITFLLFPNLHGPISPFTSLGELLFPLWLLIKGVNVEQWEKRALEPA